MSRDTISLRNLVRRFWKKTLLTWVLVLPEGVSLVLMPLVIGRAVDGMMNQSLTGIVELGCLKVFFDGRIIDEGFDFIVKVEGRDRSDHFVATRPGA